MSKKKTQFGKPAKRTVYCRDCDRTSVVRDPGFNRAGGAKCPDCGCMLEVIPYVRQSKWERNPLWFMRETPPVLTGQAKRDHNKAQIQKQKPQICRKPKRRDQSVPYVRKPPPKGLDHKAFKIHMGPIFPNWWNLRFDGGCEGNGSRFATGTWAFHVVDAEKKSRLTRNGKTVAARVTNNVSEWHALREGLKALVPLAAELPGLHIEGDSKLVIETLMGRWASKNPELSALRDECRDLLWTINANWAATWIPREENQFCDDLASGSVNRPSMKPKAVLARRHESAKTAASVELSTFRANSARSLP